MECFIDDVFSMWDVDKQEINLFIAQAKNFHPTINLAGKEITFQDTKTIFTSRMSDFKQVGCRIFTSRMSDFHNSDVRFYNSDVGFHNFVVGFSTTRMVPTSFLSRYEIWMVCNQFLGECNYVNNAVLKLLVEDRMVLLTDLWVACNHFLGIHQHDSMT